jgi:hypothetical protein
VSLKGKGPSKEKVVDSGNWGAIDLAPYEIDVGTQEVVFVSYKKANKSLNKNAMMKE